MTSCSGNDRLGRGLSAMDAGSAGYLYGQKVVERADGSTRTWSRMSPDNALHMVPFGHGSLVTTVQLFRDLGGFSTEYRVYADYDFMLRMIASGARGMPFPEEMVLFAAGGLSDTWEGRDAEKARVWGRRVGEYINLGAYAPDDIEEWLRTKIFPSEVLGELERQPKVPDGFRKAARVCRKISRRRRLKKLVFG